MLTAICGGEGSCGRCIVRVMSGEVSPPNDTEMFELAVTMWPRLAAGLPDCHRRDVRVHVPPDSLVTAQRTQTRGGHRRGARSRCARVRSAPAATTQRRLALRRSTAARCAATGGAGLEFDARVFARLPDDLRAWGSRRPHLYARQKSSMCARLHGAIGLAVDIARPSSPRTWWIEQWRDFIHRRPMNPQIATAKIDGAHQPCHQPCRA